MKIKKILVALFAALFLFSFTGCDYMYSNVDELLMPPKMDGDIYPIQQALEDAAGENITLKFPTSGEYRSSFILKDLDNDGTDEALVFYTVNGSNSVNIHINLIAYCDDEWASIGDIGVVGADVERVSFTDMNNDGRLEIVVGWITYENVDKQVGVYAFNGKTITQRAMESYTEFICADITGDASVELVTFNLNSSDKTAISQIFKLTDAGVTKIGSVMLDGGVTEYTAPKLSCLNDGTTPAIYIDAKKGKGTITEIIWFRQGVAKTLPLTDNNTQSVTYREKDLASADYDGNGVIDIPTLEMLPSTTGLPENDTVYYTKWSSFDGEIFNTIAVTFMNYADGYFIDIPIQWQGNLHVIRKTDIRTRIFYSYNSEIAMVGEELFRVMVVPVSSYDNGAYSSGDYFELERTKDVVYIAKITANNPFGIKEEDVKNIFGLIT